MYGAFELRVLGLGRPTCKLFKVYEAQKMNRHALLEGQVLNEPLKSVFVLCVTWKLECFHLQSQSHNMLAASAGPISFRYSTIKTSQRHARQLLQHRLQPRRAGSIQRCMAFDVTLITPEGEKKIQCDEGTLILDAADEAGLDLPYSCRSGSCGTCAAKLASGDMSQIEQDDNSFLEDFMTENGYFLTCSSYPKADITIQTNQEDNVYD